MRIGSKKKTKYNPQQNQTIIDNPNLINMNNNNNNNTKLNNERILLKIKKLQERYEKKICKDDMEIKVLLERNDKLEELVLKLKVSLERANEMFPDFLEQLERESKRTAVSHLEKKMRKKN
jgi:hypothetical protein